MFFLHCDDPVHTRAHEERITAVGEQIRAALDPIKDPDALAFELEQAQQHATAEHARLKAELAQAQHHAKIAATDVERAGQELAKIRERLTQTEEEHTHTQAALAAAHTERDQVRTLTAALIGKHTEQPS